jgi:hypothetical protein
MQAFTYNTQQQQLLSVDTQGGLRLWSLRGDLLHIPWAKVKAMDASLARSVATRTIETPKPAFEADKAWPGLSTTVQSAF